MSNLLPAARAQARPRGFERLGLAVFALLLFACVPGAQAHEFKAGDLEVGHPWSRATPPGAKVAGGYFTVTNKGGSPDRLLSISSDISDKAELHEMSVKDGVMT
ncbi:MAG: copper chaperone PCu(A)C, partial [Mesorhizobium sp.]